MKKRLLVLLAMALPWLSHAQTITLSTYSRGWVSDTIRNRIGNDYYNVGLGGGGEYYHNFLAFSIPSFPSALAAATISLKSFGDGFSGLGTLSLFHYTATNNPWTDLNAFNNLIAGDLIGSLVGIQDVNGVSVYKIMLNTQGVIDLNSSVGTNFIIGGNFSADPAADGYAATCFGTGHPMFDIPDDGNTTLTVVQTVPEPTTWLIVLTGGVILLFRRHKGRTRRSTRPRARPSFYDFKPFSMPVALVPCRPLAAGDLGRSMMEDARRTLSA